MRSSGYAVRILAQPHEKEWRICGRDASQQAAKEKEGIYDVVVHMRAETLEG